MHKEEPEYKNCSINTCAEIMVIYKQNPMEFIDCKSLRSSIFTLKGQGHLAVKVKWSYVTAKSKENWVLTNSVDFKNWPLLKTLFC